MKVLSMIQPWASLFVLQEIKHETRSWKTKYRGPLAIHTSKKVDKAVCNHIAIKSLLKKHGFTTDDLPTGVIIATCQLVNCLRVVQNDGSHAVLENGLIVSGNDYYGGDYKIGGYAWIVEDMKPLEQWIPAKGQLGLWEHDL